MGRRKKDANQQIKSVCELAEYQATVWIALHGIEKAKKIAKLTLEKTQAQEHIDNNGDYEKGNIRFITRTESNKNKKR